MPIPQSKTELLRQITDTYRKLSDDLDRAPADRTSDASLPGHAAGTLMTPLQLVTYLIGWNELVLSWFEQRSRGIEPELPAPGFGWNELGRLAQHFSGDFDGLTWTQARERLDTAKHQIVVLVESLSDAQLYGGAWYRTYSAGRMIQLNTASPYTNARRRLRAWLRDQQPA